jgi:predicted transcriptional regulator
VTQSRERRMYLMWRSAKRTHDYRRGGTSPLMRVAVTFRTPIRQVRDIIDSQRGRQP